LISTKASLMIYKTTFRPKTIKLVSLEMKL